MTIRNPARMAFALGEPASVARRVIAAMDAARAAVAHLQAGLRSCALAAALAEESGEPTLHRYGRIGAASLEHLLAHPDAPESEGIDVPSAILGLRRMGGGL